MAEAEEEAVLERLAGLLGALGRMAGGLEHVAGRAVDVDAEHARAASPPASARGPRARARCRSATASEMSPRTHVRVMSAQQPDASSCGHRSRQIGGVRRQRPAAGLVADGVARAHGRHDDVVGRRRAEARAHLADARAQRLGGQHLARRSAARRRRSRPRAARARTPPCPPPPRRRPGGCRPARRRSCGAGARRRARRRPSARPPRRAGDRPPRAGSRAATTAAAIPSSRTARTYSSRSIASKDSPWAISSSRPNCSPSRRSSSGACGGDAVDLEHVGEDRPAAVDLEVEERVADPERDLVAQLGRAQRVAADEDRGHQASLPISERSTYCRIPPWRK